MQQEIYKEKIEIPVYVAGDHFYPQIFFKHWEKLQEMIKRGAQSMGVKEVIFKEIKGDENTK